MDDAKRGVIYLIRNVHDELQCFPEITEWHYKVNRLLSKIDSAVKWLNVVEWVPVTKDLPEDLKTVYVTVESKDIGGTRRWTEEAYYSHIREEWSREGSQWFNDDEKVIAWAERPEPMSFHYEGWLEELERSNDRWTKKHQQK